MNEKNKPTHSPLCMAIVDKLKSQHIGSQNAISMKDLSEYFNVSERTLRYFIREIRQAQDIPLTIGSNNDGYYICTKEDFKKSNRRLYSMAFSLLKSARSNSRKASLDGQGVIDDSILEDFTHFLQAFGQDE